MSRGIKSQKIIDRINNIGLLVEREDLAQAMMNRVRAIDEAIAGVLLTIVEWDNPDEPIHETGVSVEETLNLFEERRNRLLDYIKHDLEISLDAPPVSWEDKTQVIPSIAYEDTQLTLQNGEEQGDLRG